MVTEGRKASPHEVESAIKLLLLALLVCNLQLLELLRDCTTERTHMHCKQCAW